MSDLMKFYEEFTSRIHEGVSEVRNAHTLYLCRNDIIYGSALEFVVIHCPKSCRYYVGRDIVTGEMFICVYDD